MSQTSWIPAARRTAVVTALVTAMSAATPLVAQQAGRPPSASAQTPPAQAPSGATLQLSMDQAVTMALETNLGLKRDRLDLDVASQNIVGARAAFRPTLTSGLQRQTSQSQPSSFTETSTTSTASVGVTSTWRQILPWYGGNYSVSWSGSRSTTTTTFPNFNPNLGSRLTMNFAQPLWRGFRTDGTRVGLESAQRGQEIADLNLQQQILQTQDQVRLAYLGLIGAVNGLKVAQENKKVAEDALRNAQARIAVGQAAEIDKIQTEASVLSSDEQVIVSEARVSSTEDQLRALVVDVSRPDYWQVHIEPTDEIKITPREIDVDAAIRNALASRLDLIVARRSLDITGLNVRLDENLVKPSVDFSATYSAAASGGTQFSYDQSSYPPVVTGTTIRSFGSVLGDTFGGTYPAWTFGVTVGYPLGQTAAQASLARARIQASQQQIDLHNQELAVTQAVREAARQVQSGLRRVESTQKALEANVRQLEAEQKKLSVGMSTTFDVLTKTQLLANARSAELNARIAYNQALINFDRVQKIR
jgi:outer membrane protein TolC